MELFMVVLYDNFGLIIFVADREGNVYTDRNKRYRHKKTSVVSPRGKKMFPRGITIQDLIIESDYDYIIHIDNELIPAFEEASEKKCQKN